MFPKIHYKFINIKAHGTYPAFAYIITSHAHLGNKYFTNNTLTYSPFLLTFVTDAIIMFWDCD